MPNVPANAVRKCPTCERIDWFTATFGLDPIAVAAIQCPECRTVPLDEPEPPQNAKPPA